MGENRSLRVSSCDLPPSSLPSLVLSSAVAGSTLWSPLTDRAAVTPGPVRPRPPPFTQSPWLCAKTPTTRRRPWNTEQQRTWAQSLGSGSAEQMNPGLKAPHRGPSNPHGQPGQQSLPSLETHT